MADLTQKITTARKAGYSDDEIASFLSADPALAPKIKQARASGYSSGEVIDHLGGMSTQKTANPWAAGLSPAQPSDLQTLKAGVNALASPPKKPRTVAGDIVKGVNEADSRFNGTRKPKAGDSPARQAAAFFGKVGESFNPINQGKAMLDVVAGGFNALGAGVGKGLEAAGYKHKEDPHIAANPDGTLSYFYPSAPDQRFPLMTGQGRPATKADMGKMNAMGGPLVRRDFNKAHPGPVMKGDQSLVANQDMADFGIFLGTLFTPEGGERVAATRGGKALQAAADGGAASHPLTAAQQAHEALDATLPAVRASAPPVPRISSAKAKAIKMARRDAQLYGRTIRQNMAENPEATFAEAAGPRGMDRMKALAGMKDLPVGERVKAEMGARAAQTPDRINRSFEGATGIAPEEAQAGIDKLVLAGQKQAKPFYEKAFQASADNPKIRDLIRRVPAIRKSLRIAAEHLLDRSINPNETIDTLVIPEGFATGNPAGNADTYLKDVMELRAGAARKEAMRGGKSLTEHLAGEGGIADKTGDLRGMDAHRVLLNKGVGQLKKLVRDTGMSLDDAAIKAWEAGYFNEVPTSNELLDAMRRELGGQRIQSIHNTNDRGRQRFLQGLDERISRLGVPGDASPKVIAKALADEDAYMQHLNDFAEGKHASMSPVAGEEQIPSFQLLDMTKRVIDSNLRRAVELKDKESIISLTHAKNALTEQLKTLSPDYVQALDVSGDYLSAKEAFDEAPRRFSAPGGTNYDYEQYIQGLTPQQKQAHYAGIGSDLNRRMFSKEAGPQAMDFVTSPNARGRLNVGLGLAKGEKLSSDIQNAVKTRQASAELLAAAKRGHVSEEQRQILQSLGVHDLNAIPTNKRDLFRMTANFVVDLGKDIIHRQQLGWNKEALTEYANLMLQRADLTIADIHKVTETEGGSGVVERLLKSIGKTASRPPRKAKPPSKFGPVNALMPPLKSVARAGALNALMQEKPLKRREGTH